MWKPLEEETIGQRIIITVVICLVILGIFAFIGWLLGWDVAARDVERSKWDAQIIELDKQALTAAYSAQVQKIFTNWVAEGLPPSQRARNGFANAHRGFVGAMTEIEKREAAR